MAKSRSKRRQRSIRRGRGKGSAGRREAQGPSSASASSSPTKPPSPTRPSSPAPSRRRPRVAAFTRGDLLWAAGLSLLAWLHRLAFLVSNRDRAWPFTIFYEGDAETFYRYARAILAGELYDSGLPFHPPGFAYALAGLHTLLGAGDAAAAVPHFAVKVTLAALSSLLVGGLYLLVTPYLGRTAALVAALLATYHFGLYVLAVAPVSEGLYLTLLVFTLLLWSRGLAHPLAVPGAAPRRQRLAGLVLGVLLGLLCLTRAEAALLALLLLAVGVLGAWRQREGRGVGRPVVVALVPWVLVALGLVLTLLPWTLRNARTLAAAEDRLAGRLAEPLPDFVPLTLYGPLNLALANHPDADGTFSRDLLSSQRQSGVLDLADPEHLELLLHGDRHARAFIRDQPGAYLRLVLRKWALTAEAGRLGWTQWNWPGGLDGLRRPVDLFAPHRSYNLWLLAPLTLAGLILCLRLPGGPRRWAGITLLLASATLVTTALFFGYVRQGMLFMPFALTLTAATLVAAGERLLAHRPITATLGHNPSRPLLATLAATTLLLLLAATLGARADRNYTASGTTLPGSNKLNRDLAVTLELQRGE